jgi:hypothetical protein
MVGDYISTSYGSNGLALGVFGRALTPTTGAGTSCTTSALDNCDAPMSTFAAGQAAAVAVATSGPVLFSGRGGATASSLWKVVDNNGSKHRD